MERDLCGVKSCQVEAKHTFKLGDGCEFDFCDEHILEGASRFNELCTASEKLDAKKRQLIRDAMRDMFLLDIP